MVHEMEIFALFLQTDKKLKGTFGIVRAVEYFGRLHP